MFHPRLCGNCSFPQNFHTRKLGEITVFYAVWDLQNRVAKNRAARLVAPVKTYFTKCDPGYKTNFRRKRIARKLIYKTLKIKTPTDVSHTFIIILVRQGGLYGKNRIVNSDVVSKVLFDISLMDVTQNLIFVTIYCIYSVLLIILFKATFFWKTILVVIYAKILHPSFIPTIYENFNSLFLLI